MVVEEEKKRRHTQGGKKQRKSKKKTLDESREILDQMETKENMKVKKKFKKEELPFSPER